MSVKLTSKHQMKRRDNLMYDGCEPHWECIICGECIPFHCCTKEQCEQMDCPEEKDRCWKNWN